MLTAKSTLGALAALALPCLSVASLSHAAELPKPTLVPTALDNVFVPVGFDDNDNVEIIVAGHFTNVCSKVGPLTAEVNEDARIITLSPQTWVYQSVRCETQEIYVPFIQSVALGTLSRGDYKVVVASAPQLDSRDLVVAKATQSTPDDYTYAPVENVEVTRDAESGRITGVEVSGTFSRFLAGCTKFKELRATITKGNVMVVLPIAEFTPNKPCENPTGDRKFRARAKVEGAPATDMLLHVRVMNGMSINKVARATR